MINGQLPPLIQPENNAPQGQPPAEQENCGKILAVVIPIFRFSFVVIGAVLSGVYPAGTLGFFALFCVIEMIWKCCEKRFFARPPNPEGAPEAAARAA